jgi:hypothetical protein
MRYFVCTLVSKQLIEWLILFVGWGTLRLNLSPKVRREIVPRGSPVVEFARLNVA